jgi:hypothetical protein
MKTEKNPRSKKEFVVYNSNDPSLFTMFEVDGYTFDADHYGIIEAACKRGPFLAFFVDYPFFTFRIRGPFAGFNVGDCDPETPDYWCIDCTGIPYDTTRKNIVETIKAKIREIQQNV